MIPSHIRQQARGLSILAVLGWVADTCGNLLLHRGWWALVPAITTGTSLFLAIRLQKEMDRA